MNKEIIILIIIILVGSFLFLGQAFAYPTVYPKGLTIDVPSKTYDGYTTFKRTHFNEEGKPMGEDIEMIDMEGNVVHKWEDVGYTLHYDLLDNGHIILGEFLHQCPGGGCPIDGKRPPVAGNLRALVERDWQNNIVWTYENDHLHHDLDVLPDGNIMAIFYTELPEELNDRVKGGIPGSESGNSNGGYGDGYGYGYSSGPGDAVIYTDIVRLIDRNGNSLWEWIPYQELNISDYPLNLNNARDHWPYINHAKYLPKDNPFNGKESVLISMRNSDTLIIVDMETKEVAWEWGKGELSQQHEPVLLDNGNILVFDNGRHRKDGPSWIKFSRVLEINPRTKKIVWEYTGHQPGDSNGFPFYTPVGGFLHRLANGNILISECWGGGRIFEVTPEKEIVWEYVTEVNGVTTIRRYNQSEVNWPEKLPPPRPTGAKLGGKEIVDGWVIKKETMPPQAICVLGWLIAALGIAWVIKTKLSGRKKSS